MNEDERQTPDRFTRTRTKTTALARSLLTRVRQAVGRR